MAAPHNSNTGSAADITCTYWIQCLRTQEVTALKAVTVIPTQLRQQLTAYGPPLTWSSGSSLNLS